MDAYLIEQQAYLLRISIEVESMKVENKTRDLAQFSPAYCESDFANLAIEAENIGVNLRNYISL